MRNFYQKPLTDQDESIVKDFQLLGEWTIVRPLPESVFPKTTASGLFLPNQNEAQQAVKTFLYKIVRVSSELASNQPDLKEGLVVTCPASTPEQINGIYFVLHARDIQVIWSPEQSKNILALTSI